MYHSAGAERALDPTMIKAILLAWWAVEDTVRGRSRLGMGDVSECTYWHCNAIDCPCWDREQKRRQADLRRQS